MYPFKNQLRILCSEGIQAEHTSSGALLVSFKRNEHIVGFWNTSLPIVSHVGFWRNISFTYKRKDNNSFKILFFFCFYYVQTTPFFCMFFFNKPCLLYLLSFKRTKKILKAQMLMLCRTFVNKIDDCFIV